MSNWDIFQNCCQTDQLIIMVALLVSTIVSAILWNTFILFPFKLMTVFLHESGHALATLCTGGKVEGIEVNKQEGGSTLTRGGWSCCILPAGYLGSGLWGCFFILMASLAYLVSVWTARAAAITIILLSIWVLIFKSDNCLLRSVLILFIILFIGVWILDEVLDSRQPHELVCFEIFFGVMNNLYKIRDIWDDLIARSVRESDASKFAKTFFGSPKCWGVIWIIFSLLWYIGSCYLAIMIPAL